MLVLVPEGLLLFLFLWPVIPLIRDMIRSSSHFASRIDILTFIYIFIITYVAKTENAD